MIAYTRFQARMRAAVEGASHQAHLEVLAKRGDEDARRALEGPEFPEEVGYLWGWFCELAPTREVSEYGLRGFTYPMLESWARMTGRSPDPVEVEALFQMDRVDRFPDPPTEKATDG